jgi:hypothetical protein
VLPPLVRLFREYGNVSFLLAHQPALEVISGTFNLMRVHLVDDRPDEQVAVVTFFFRSHIRQLPVPYAYFTEPFMLATAGMCAMYGDRN